MQREIRVSVHPGAKKETVVQKSEQQLEISVKEPAQHNMANIRVRELVAEHYGVSTNSVRQTTGHKSRTKRFVVKTGF